MIGLPQPINSSDKDSYPLATQAATPAHLTEPLGRNGRALFRFSDVLDQSRRKHLRGRWGRRRTGSCVASMASRRCLRQPGQKQGRVERTISAALLDAVREAALAAIGIRHGPLWLFEDTLRSGAARLMLRDYIGPPVPLQIVYAASRLLPRCTAKTACPTFRHN
jgi:DNA-binding transcriptional LysR family regulator